MFSELCCLKVKVQLAQLRGSLGPSASSASIRVPKGLKTAFLMYNSDDLTNQSEDSARRANMNCTISTMRASYS